MVISTGNGWYRPGADEAVPKNTDNSLQRMHESTEGDDVTIAKQATVWIDFNPSMDK